MIELRSNAEKCPPYNDTNFGDLNYLCTYFFFLNLHDYTLFQFLRADLHTIFVLVIIKPSLNK